MAELTEQQKQQLLDLAASLAAPATNAVGQSVQPTPTGDIPAGATLLGTFPDNGRVYELPDGSRGAISAGISTTNPETVARIMEGMTPAEATAGSWQQSAIQENPGLARASVAVQGTPFMGNWTDEIAGLTGGPVANRAMDYMQQAMADQRPGETMGLQTATGLLALAPALPLAAGYVSGGTNLLGQAMRGGMVAGTGGFFEGLLNGAGNENGDGRNPTWDRVTNAVKSAGINTTIAGLLGFGAVPALRGIGNMLTDGTQKAAVAATGASPEATRFVSNVLASEDPAQAARNIGEAGPTGMLADAGPVTQGVLDALMQTPGAAGRTGRQRISDRAATVMGDMTQGLDNTLGKPQGLISVEEAIRTNAAPQIRQAYEAAYSTPIDYSSAQGMAVEDLLGRLPEGTALSAIKKANDRMRFDGSPANQIMASIADDGSVTFQEMPNVMQLDYMKRAFDAIARDGTDPITGAMSSDAAFARKVAQSIRDATRDAVPAYGQALELAADDLSQRAAVDFGAKILSPNTTREMVAREIKGATKPELTAMRLALRSQIDETLANVRRVASNPLDDNSARQLGATFNMLNSDAAQTKMRALLGPDADFLIQNITETQRALGLKNAVNTNSRTFGRGLVGELISQAAEPGLLGQVAQGRGIDATQRFVQELTLMTPENITARTQSLINEVTDILTRSGNAQAMQALKALQQASGGTPVTEKQAYQIARAVTSAVGTGAYQQGSQSLVGPQNGLLAR